MAKEVEPQTKTERSETVVIHRNWAYGLGALLVLLVVLVIGLGIAGRHDNFSNGMRPGKGGFRSSLAPRERGLRMGGQQAGDVNSGNRASGVVTAVNGNSFTLAGFGSTTNVTTDSSTQYQGGNTVKVNDTVIVKGTTTNGTLTATQVNINP